MHPPLDRPHPDCENIIQSLKQCHSEKWRKFTGACNQVKVELDNCFKAEKKRLLDKMNEDLGEQQKQHEQMVKVAFGKSLTFTEYLKRSKAETADTAQKSGK
jgi:COX assembly mitochondrial protein 2